MPDNTEAIAALVARKIRPSNITLMVIGLLLSVIGYLANNTLTSIQTDLRAHGETLTEVPVISASVKKIEASITDLPVIAASVGRIETGITVLTKDVTEIGRDVAALKAVGKTASLSTLRR